jgi:hypothetical protein
MLPDTGIDDVKKQRNAEYAKHINDPVLSSLKMGGIRLLFSYMFIPNLYMFRTLMCPSSGELIVSIRHLVYIYIYIYIYFLI